MDDEWALSQASQRKLYTKFLLRLDVFPLDLYNNFMNTL